MGTCIVLTAVDVLSCHIVLHLTFLANVHVVVLAKCESLGHESDVAGLGLLPGIRLHVASRVNSDHLVPLLELEASAIKLENFHEGLALQDTVLEVAVLLTVEVLLALGVHIVQHVLRQVLQIDLQIARVRVHRVVDQESQEFLLAGAALNGCFNHFSFLSVGCW